MSPKNVSSFMRVSTVLSLLSIVATCYYLLLLLVVNGPNNYDENSEVGRGGEENDYANRYSKQNFFDGITEGAMARMTGGGGQNQAYDG